jgi:hypothetical protein
LREAPLRLLSRETYGAESFVGGPMTELHKESKNEIVIEKTEILHYESSTSNVMALGNPGLKEITQFLQRT